MALTRTHRTFIVAAAVAVIVTAANASQGSYFSQSWGWVALAFLVPTTVLLILDRVTSPGRLRVAFAGLMAALGVWIALSATWSISSAGTIREVERMLVYVALALAVALVLRRGDGPGVLAGLLVGVVLISSYGLGTRLLPDRLETTADPATLSRLAEPVGYWNALGLLAAMGLLLAMGFVAHSRGTGLGVLAGAAVPILALTAYFTFSRGAWVALLLGFVVSVVLDPRRLRYLWTAVVQVVPSIVCIGYASQQQRLTSVVSTSDAAALDEGHAVAIILAVCVVASGLIAYGARRLARRVPAPRRFRRGVDLALVGAVLAGIMCGAVAVGGPVAGVSKLRDKFGGVSNFEHRVESGETEVDLNQRLFSVSGSGRAEQMRVAWNAARDHPVVGNGSGSFEYLWYEHRRDDLVVRDGHSLYLETFAELGFVGLAVLLAALVLPAVGAVRARRGRFISVGLGAFAAWVAAAAIDWHWEMVGVTISGLLAGAAALLASERGASRTLDTSVRLPLIAVGVILSTAAVWSLVGNQALFAGREAIDRQDWAEAREDGRRANALLFWSAEPDLVLGDAAAGLGDREEALRNYRDAVSTDPHSWVAWLRLAQVSRGAERAAAYRRVRRLNPREEGLPGQ